MSRQPTEVDILRDASVRLRLISDWIRFDRPTAADVVDVLVREIAIVTVDAVVAQHGTRLGEHDHE